MKVREWQDLIDSTSHEIAQQHGVTVAVQVLLDGAGHRAKQSGMSAQAFAAAFMDVLKKRVLEQVNQGELE